jgi:hypothetical protein
MNTPSPFFPGTGTYGGMFTDALIAQRSVEKYVVKTYPQFNLYNKLIDALGTPALEHVGNRLFDMYAKGNTYPSASVATRTLQPNGTLNITWDDSNFEAIVPGNAVVSTTGTIALVDSTTPGTATLSFFYSEAGDTAFVSGDFAVGTQVSDRGDVGNIQNSGSKQRVMERPYRNQNIVDLVRNTAEMNMDELNTLTYITNINGTPYYAQNAVLEMLERTAKQKYTRTVDGVFKNDPRTPMGMGFRNQIRTQGGIYRAMTSALDEDEFLALIDQIIANGGTNGNEFLIICGSSYAGYFQRFMKTYLVTAGDTNTFGGVSIKGINVMDYWYIGKHFRLMVDPSMDNSAMFPGESTALPGVLKRSHAAFIFDTSRVLTEQGSEPFMKKKYFGPAGADMWVTPINGLVNIQNNTLSVVPTHAGLNGKVEVLYNCTTQLTNPAAHAFHYLSV